jgi:NTP pyrophosphatase (non-canonical NTP hydrolase)
MTDTTPSIESDIESFNERHQVTTSQQLRQLAEEVGELNQAINESQHAPFVAIEAADVAFVALSIASLYSDEPMRQLEDVAYKNSLKDTSTNGDKVTKSTDGSGDGAGGSPPASTFDEWVEENYFEKEDDDEDYFPRNRP